MRNLLIFLIAVAGSAYADCTVVQRSATHRDVYCEGNAPRYEPPPRTITTYTTVEYEAPYPTRPVGVYTGGVTQRQESGWAQGSRYRNIWRDGYDRR